MIKRKRYYYENLMVTGVDKTTMYQLEALYTKYTRDYLPYFKSLAQMYKKGDQKRFAEESVIAVEKVRSLIDSILKTGGINEQDTQKLFDLIDEIEDRKDSFVRKAQTNKSLADKMDEVSKRTGVTPEDMSITQGIGRRAATQAKQVTKEGREGISPFLRRTAPKGSQFVSGTLSSVLGPFSPVLSAAGSFAHEAVNVVKGVSSKIQDWSSRRSQTNLRPVGVTNIPMDSTGRSTWSGEPRTVRTSRSGGEPYAPLMMFFDKGAYKAKWTKELLDTTKKLVERTKGTGNDLLGDLVPNLKDFALGLGLFIGKAGLWALAVTAIGVEISATKSASDKYNVAKKEEAAAVERQASADRDQFKVMEEIGLSEFAKRAGKSPRQVLIEKEAVRQRVEEKRYTALPWYSREKLHGRFIGAYTGRNPHAPEGPLVPHERRIQILQERLNKLNSQPSGSSKLPEMKVTIPGLEDVPKAILDSIEQMKQNVQVQQPVPRLVNVHDSGDVLTREHAKGDLTLGE